MKILKEGDPTKKHIDPLEIAYICKMCSCKFMIDSLNEVAEQHVQLQRETITNYIVDCPWCGRNVDLVKSRIGGPNE